MAEGTEAHILVLGGGPDAERDVSIESSRCVAEALQIAGFSVTRELIERLSADELARLPGDVIFPVLHGGWGEGGPLQDILESDGRPFVGCEALPARHAMDKIGAKLTAAAAGIPTAPLRTLDLRDAACPLPLPVAVKPVQEGSTIGLHICHTLEQWGRARAQIEREVIEGGAASAARVYMIEPFIKGRELTVGLIDNHALPVIEIIPAAGLYDYEAKYTRDDTQYVLRPELPVGVAERIREQSETLARAMGVRHVARVDFILDDAGDAWLLEINTMPGFTTHSLVPMAARAEGLDMPRLCARLVELALRDHAGRSTHALSGQQ